MRDDFKPDHKITTAQRLCQQADADCRVTLANFEVILRDALELFDLATVTALEAAATGLLRGKGAGRATTRQRRARA